jgi:hypothetical protein
MNEKEQSAAAIPPEKKPNENAGFFFSSSIKITDPNTNEVLVHVRAD